MDDFSNVQRWNSYSDVAVLNMSTVVNLVVGPQDYGQAGTSGLGVEPQPSAISSPISNTPICPSQMPLGSEITVIGYPVTTQNTIGTGLFAFFMQDSPRTVTNGKISAIDVSTSINLPYHDYFTTAAIDSGNSGGLALSKYQNHVCLLGIPTWVSQGNYQNQGIIQNINNIMWKDK